LSFTLWVVVVVVELRLPLLPVVMAAGAVALMAKQTHLL
jgi:hypothetical protein